MKSQECVTVPAGKALYTTAGTGTHTKGLGTPGALQIPSYIPSLTVADKIAWPGAPSTTSFPHAVVHTEKCLKVSASQAGQIVPDLDKPLVIDLDASCSQDARTSS